MPVITIDTPPMSKQQKAELVKVFSEEASRIIGLPVSAMVVLIREMGAENVGVGNCLLCDLERTE
jgi:4-oxalocrotonate tautomerase